jgi:hypothetical protein
MEVLALGVAPPRQSSTLTLKSTTDSSQPLAGCDVYVSAAWDSKPVFLGRTDFQGTLEVPPADNPLQILLITQGGQRLAQLPVVPGLEPRLALAVAPDARRMELDELSSALHDAAIDWAARYEALASRLKKRIAAGQYDEAERLLSELREMPTVEEHIKTNVRRLTKDIPSDPALRSRIDAIMTDVQTVLTSQLDAKAIDELARQIQKGREKPGKP